MNVRVEFYLCIIWEKLCSLAIFNRSLEMNFLLCIFLFVQLGSIHKGSESAKYNATNLDSRFYIVYFNDLICVIYKLDCMFRYLHLHFSLGNNLKTQDLIENMQTFIKESKVPGKS